MKTKRILGLGGLVVLSLGLMVSAQTLDFPDYSEPPVFEEGRDYVAERSDLMRSVGRELRALRDHLNAEDSAASMASLNVLLAAGQEFPALLPQGSESQRTPDTIWSDWDGFIVESQGLSQAALTTLTAVEAGDFTAALAAYGGIAATCSSCHRAYRN